MDNRPKLYAEIAELTMGHCKATCNRLGSCCSGEYCEYAIETARDEYGLTLERGINVQLPMLGADGKCIAPPHVRPFCSLHSCDISSVGYFKNEQPGEPLTKKYFSIREQINEEEYKQRHDN